MPLMCLHQKTIDVHTCVNKRWHTSIAFFFFFSLSSSHSVTQGIMLVLIVLSGNNPLAKWKNYKAKGFNLKSQHKKVITDEKKKTSDILL